MVSISDTFVLDPSHQFDGNSPQLYLELAPQMTLTPEAIVGIVALFIMCLSGIPFLARLICRRLRSSRVLLAHQNMIVPTPYQSLLSTYPPRLTRVASLHRDLELIGEANANELFLLESGIMYANVSNHPLLAHSSRKLIAEPKRTMSNETIVFAGNITDAFPNPQPFAHFRNQEMSMGLSAIAPRAG